MVDKPAYYWDSCLFYEVLCNEQVRPEKKAAADEILSANKQKKNIILTSVVTHIECVPAKLEIKKPGALLQYESLFDGVHFADVEITANILKLAREIRDYYFVPYDPVKPKASKMMDMGDAIHLATAIIFEVSEFHTRDEQAKGSKVPLVGLYEYSNIDKVCGKYPLKIVSPESEQGQLL